MRVTQNTNFNAIQESIKRSKTRMEKGQVELSTMKKLNRPSDNPVGASKILEVRTQDAKSRQYFENAKLAEAFLSNTDHALNDLSSILVRAKEIAVGQASGASSTSDTRLGVAEEVGQLYQQAVALANTRVGDRYLFAGYQVDRAPVDVDGKYEGDNGKMMVEVANDVFISMNLPGFEVFNTEPDASADMRRMKGGQEDPRAELPERNLAGEVRSDLKENANVFDEIQKLRISLLTGDMEGIRSTLTRFDDLHSGVVASRAKIGARLSGLESTVNSLERVKLTNAELTSSIEDADLVEVMNDLAKEETVFRTVLSASNRLVQPTLMDFLK